jgi:hypothetical protein
MINLFLNKIIQSAVHQTNMRIWQMNHPTRSYVIHMDLIHLFGMAGKEGCVGRELAKRGNYA